jgi:hypothetical protein
MLNLLYERLSAAKQTILQLENLVAVLTQREGDQILHVYNSPTPAAERLPNVTTTTLREFFHYDLSSYNGILISFPSIDSLRGDLITKGPLFFPIEQIFYERNEVQALYRTMANLSVEMMRRLKEEGDTLPLPVRLAFEAKALQLSLPGMLTDRDCTNLIAVLPMGELNRFITMKSLQLVYLQNEGAEANRSEWSQKPDQTWVIAMEEAGLINPHIIPKSPRFLELTSVLRFMKKEDEIENTRRKLAQQIFQQAQGNPAFISSAWELAAESWLAQIECEDLVAFYPHTDFLHFLKTGESLRVYRFLENPGETINALPGIDISLRDLLHNPPFSSYGALIFSFPALLDLLPKPTSFANIELSKTLWKIGKEKVLARCLWLLAFDISQDFYGSMPNPIPMLKMLLDMIDRACIFYSLSDPWEWRQGRWQLYLKGAYDTRQQILQRAVHSLPPSYSDFYKALSLWYGCDTASNIEGNIREMLDTLHEFRRIQRGNATPANSEMLITDQLIDAAEKLLNLAPSQTEFGVPMGKESVSLPRENTLSVLRRAANFAAPVPLISPFFTRSWQCLLETRRSRQSLYAQERNINRLIKQLNQLESNLQNEQRSLFAPAHEQRALQFAFSQEIQTIRGLLHELETSAKITVRLKNTWVDIYQPVLLALDVTNRGRVEAESIEIALNPSNGFQILDRSPVREIPILKPGAPNQVEYNILPEMEDCELRLEFNFRDRSGQRHKDTWTTHLTVRSLDTQPFIVKTNNYHIGRPIQKLTDFYGRRGELQNILSLLKAGGNQNVLLRGPRRMGKTSLLYMIQSALTNVDTRRFFEIPADWDSALDKVHPVFLSLHSFDITAGAISVDQFFRTLLEKTLAAFQVEKRKTKMALRDFEVRSEQVGAVNAALEQMSRLFDKFPEERLTVLLDEYDEMYRPETGVLDRHLREFVSAEHRLTWIIASTLALFQEVKTISSPWFNVFMIIELSRLSDESATTLVEGPTKDEMVFWRSDAVLALLTETGRHPFFTQLFCGKVISHLNQVKTNYVLRDTIFTIADQIVDEQETTTNHFDYFWSESRGTGQLIMLILDDSDTPLRREKIREKVRTRLEKQFNNLPKQVVDENGDPFEWQEREFKNQIDWIEKITNAVSQDEQGQFVFTVPLYRRWLRRRRLSSDLERETLEKIGVEMDHDGIRIS